MAPRFLILPTDETRPAGAGFGGPRVARAVELPDGLDEIRVGRRGDVELSLPFAVLSGVHARLSRASGASGAGWVVEDMASTNGTWLDGARLPPGERRPLAPGAELRFASVRLRFDGEAGALAAREGTATIARRLVDDLFGGAGGAPTIRVVGGAPAASLALAVPGRAYVAGRAEGCALQLAVEEVSREHAVFARGPEGVVVRDLGSKNGVVVAGARVVGERALTDGDVVTVGPVTLTLDDPAARYLRELEQMPVEGAGSQAPPAETSSAPAAAEPLAPLPATAPPVAAGASAAASAPAPRPEGKPRGARIGGSQVIVGIAVSVLVLLAVAAGVLVFARG
jgi:pSer/pThr/pTyr-binding forkhead associated (FHA) protein